MTPKEKEKAKELVEKFIEQLDMDLFDAKQCALICVDEKIELLNYIWDEYNIDDEWLGDIISREQNNLLIIKSEIEKL